MAKKRKKRVFNLLKPAVELKSLWEKIYDWLIIQARVVITISLIAIVVALVAKVVLDNEAEQKLNRLDELQAELAGLELREREIRQVQSRVEDYQIIWNQASNYTEVLESIEEITEEFDDQISVQINRDTLNISGQEDLSELLLLESELKDSFLFEDVLTQNLSQDAESIQTGIGQFLFLGIIKEEFLLRDQI